MGNKSSFMLQDEEINLISQETGFSSTQIEKLYTRFTSLDKEGNGSLSRDDFLRVPELAINPLCDRIVQMFFADCDEDHDRINFRQFMKVLAIFRPNNKSNKSSRNPSRQENEHNHHHFALPPAVKDMNNKNRLGENINQTSQSRYNNNLAPNNLHLAVQRKFSQENSIATLLGRSFSQDGLSLRSLGSFDRDDHPSSAIQGSFYRPHHQRHSSNDGFLNYYQHHHHTTNQHSVHYAAGPSQPTIGLNQLHNPLIDMDEPLNSRKQKLYFMFKIYDVDNDNRIVLSDLQSMLKMMVGNFIDDAQKAKISRRAFGEADLNCDGYIDFDEFCRVFDGIDLDEKLKIRFSH